MWERNARDIKAGGLPHWGRGCSCERQSTGATVWEMPFPPSSPTHLLSGFLSLEVWHDHSLIRWVWWCRLLKLSVCLLPCPLLSYLKMTVYKCRSKCWHDLLPPLLLQSWKQNVYSPSNSTPGKHQVWETSAQKVKVCKSYKWLEGEQWKVLDNLNNRRYYSTAYNNNNSPFIHWR